MNKKMRECFTPHAMIHSLTGVGIGIIAANLIPILNSLMVGLIVLVIGIIWDMMRK